MKSGINVFKNTTKVLVLFGLCATLVGNLGCKETEPQPEPRQLRRRVQMGKITAPEITLPASLGNQKFNFTYVANMQMYDVLRTTQSFSTANVDPNSTFDPADLNSDAQQEFNRCDESTQEFQVFDSTTGQKVLSPYVKGDVSMTAACLIDMPQAVISGSINDFALISSTGASLNIAGIPWLGGLTFEYEKYSLEVELLAKSPLERGDHYMETTIQNSYGKKMGGSIQLNFGGFQLGPKAYFSSPLSQVVKEGLVNAVSDLAKKWSADDPWYAMVMKSCDKFIYINGGFGNDANLKVGDIVAIKNVEYFWTGKACQSNSYGEIPQKVVAYAKITSVGRNISAAEIIEHDVNYPHKPDRIYPGARVYMQKMVEQVKPAAAN